MSYEVTQASALSRYYDAFQGTSLKIGDNWVAPSLAQKYNDPWFWYVVISLKDLSVVANEASESATDVPADILAYQGKPGYFMFFITNSARGYTIPQGGVADFLAKTGAGGQLARMEQLVEQLGTGTLTYYSYILGATTDTGDAPGFESASFWNPCLMAIQFVPIYDQDNNFLSYAAVRSQDAENPGSSSDSSD